MGIRTQFTIAMALFGVLLVGVAGLLVVTNQQVARLNEQEELARRIEANARELSYLSNDYLLHRESQQRARWEAKLASFSQDVARLRSEGPEQQALVNSIKANRERMEAVFTEVVSAVESAPRFQDAAAQLAFTQVSWSRIEIQNQGVVFDSSRLSQMLREQIDQQKQRSYLLILVLIGVFGVYLLTNYYMVHRRVLGSISDLREGTRIVGSGNLDFAIAVKRNDEIGELSRAFNQMAADLRGVTASKAELEREIAERKRAEEEIRQLNRSLSRRAAELEVANRELEAFSYSASHDLRAPLRHIDGFSQILLQDYAGRLDEQGRQYLQFVRSGSQKMDQLIGALLKLARVTRAEMRREPVNMSELATSILAELHRGQPERQMEAVVGPGMITEGDPQLLRVVLDNLLGNAWKFTARRQVARIEFGLSRQEDKPVYFVKDNGAGFDTAYAAKLFGAFQRLHGAEEFPGTGIGLATVQRIVHRHGGRVWAEGEVDKGATFRFTLG